MKNLLLLSLISIIALSCNKNKKFSKRLSGESWSINEITIDGDKQEDLATLTFNECDIYKDNCFASWEVDGDKANFVWQFRDKAKVFEISNQSELSDDLELAIRQCINYSGIYNVTNDSKTSLTIKSSSTIGYENEEVIIKIQKQ